MQDTSKALALIIGPGAVGVAISDQLRRVGIESVFIGRPNKHPVDIRSVKFETLDGTHEIEWRPPSPSPSRASPIQLVIIAVKAYDLAAALRDVFAVWQDKFADGVPVIPVCNGSVQTEIAAAAQRWPRFLWRLGICTFGVTRLDVAHYALRSQKGRLQWGAYLPRDSGPTVSEQRLGGAPLCKFEANILPLVQRKWLYNTVLNSLTAAKRLARNGDVLLHEAELKAVFQEALQLGATLFGAWNTDAPTLYQGLLELIEDTKANENSMARDRRLGLPTESAFLAGLAVQGTTQESLQYPKLAALHHILTSAE